MWVVQRAEWSVAEQLPKWVFFFELLTDWDHPKISPGRYFFYCSCVISWTRPFDGHTDEGPSEVAMWHCYGQSHHYATSAQFTDRPLQQTTPHRRPARVRSVTDMLLV